RRPLRDRHRRHCWWARQGRRRRYGWHQYPQGRSESAYCRRLFKREHQPVKNFKLSRWALEHKSLVVYLMLLVALAGIMEYRKLGREEDPPFTIKTMVVKT